MEDLARLRISWPWILSGYFVMLRLTASISRVYTNAYPFHKAGCNAAHALNMRKLRGERERELWKTSRCSLWRIRSAVILVCRNTAPAVNIKVNRECFACTADVTGDLLYAACRRWKTWDLHPVTRASVCAGSVSAVPSRRKVNVQSYWGERS